MKSQKNLPQLSPEENLKMENDLLKAKLTAEFGMLHTGSGLEGAAENEWLNHIYDFEKTYAGAERISIYEFLGKPEFQYIEDLEEEEISSELERLYDIMGKNGIMLDTLCEYDDSVMYKFLTEEFFNEETDNIRMEGMNHCFLYEEFHPNHEYDLRKQSEEFISSVFEKEWNIQFDVIHLYETVEFKKLKYDRVSFMELIVDFQASHKPISLNSTEIQNIEFDTEKGIAEVNGDISYKTGDGKYSGEFRFLFIFDFGYWYICDIILPEFG